MEFVHSGQDLVAWKGVERGLKLVCIPLPLQNLNQNVDVSLE